MDQLSVRMPSLLHGRVAGFLVVCGDIIALLAALSLSLMLRFDGISLSDVYHTYLAPHILSLPFALLAYIGIFKAFRLYKYAWRFAGLETLRGVIFGNILGLFVLIAIELAWAGFTLPRSVLVIFLMTSIASVGAVRMLLRLISLGNSYAGRALNVLRRDLQPKRIIILGSGSHGARLLDALREERQLPYKVIGFLDDWASRYGIYIHDVCVLGPLNHLYQLLEESAVDEVLIALPDAPGSEIREYVMACRKRKIPVKVIPGVLNGHTDVHIEDISVEDLLRRPAVRMNMAEVERYLTGKRVLITGAGGSIGSELCRQIVKLKPTKLVLLGHGENSIHQVYHELIRTDPGLIDVLSMAIASVADSVRIDQVFEENRPQIVFHAAAHKHVPIMEDNVLEAVQNNVIGTYNVAEACGRHGVSHMVLISTDKAVYPTSVLGATKRICEETLRALVSLFPNTSFISVRFGNVLGSRGSAVPIFHEQIRRGGPVTVTHKDMTRFFMSVTEATHLVLQAGAGSGSGELYLLDMGSPVKIVDLACDMIRLCGFEPDVDIPVVFTGIRPGEKLHEELAEEEETVTPAPCKGLYVVKRSDSFDGQQVLVALRELKTLVAQGDAEHLHSVLYEIVSKCSNHISIKEIEREFAKSTEA